MIRNERQYRITRAQAERFSRTLDSLSRSSVDREGTPPLIARAQEDALRSQLADLEGELREYESLKAGKLPADDLSVVSELPTALIRARIARGLSQRDLAERLGIKEQQIQRYEATEYASASLARIREVAGALDSGSCGPGPATSS